MTTKINTGAGGTNGAAVTTGNSGGASGDALDAITLAGAGALTYSNDDPVLSGHMWWRFAAAAGGTDRVRAYHSFAASDYISQRFYFMWESDPGAANVMWAAIDNGGSFSQAIVLQLTTVSGARHLQLTTGGTLRKDFGAITYGTAATDKYMIDLYAVKGAGTGTLVCELYDDTGTLVDSYSVIGTAQTGSQQFIRSQWGGNTGVLQAMRIGTVKGNNDSPGGLQGPAASNVAPVATAQARPVQVAEGTVNVTGTITDTDGTVKTGTWSIVSGPNSPTVTVSTVNLNTASCTVNGSFTGVAGQYVLRLSGTDNADVASNNSDVIVDVYPANNADVGFRAEVSNAGAWTVTGAGTRLEAINNQSTTDYAESPSGPANAAVRYRMNAYGPGVCRLKLGVYQNPSSPSTTLTCQAYKADNTTALGAPTVITVPASLAADPADDPEAVIDSTGMALIPNLADRQELIWELKANQ